MLRQKEHTALHTGAKARLVCNTQNITMSNCEGLTNTWKGGGNSDLHLVGSGLRLRTTFKGEAKPKPEDGRGFALSVHSYDIAFMS